jgi:hypothetical protein
VTVTGFEIGEIDMIVENDDKDWLESDAVEPDPGPLVTKLGDQWKLGKHRLLCGNSLEEHSYLSLMAKRRADAVFTDPPYNLQIEGHVCGKGSVHHREFAMASGEMNADQSLF